MNYPLSISPFGIASRSRNWVFHRPLVMGILNATNDSFYDGGRYNTPDALLAHARLLLDQGADLLDLGVMSSRPGASMPSQQEEADRLAPLVALLRRELPEALLSVDTCRSLPAARAVECGADIVNDISGGQLDPEMLPTVASLHVPYILMHMRGTPATMQLPENTRYNDIIDDLSRYFDEKLNTLLRLGCNEVWLDPGLGFAKTDLHRGMRQGIAEVIYGAGKTPEQILRIAENLHTHGQKSVLITRMSRESADLIGESGMEFTYDELSRVGIVGRIPEADGRGTIVIATGGTSDIPIAEEAAKTAEVFGNTVMRLYDVGVAGIHRLLNHQREIQSARVIIAIAGMEGALASVIGGLASCPVIAVPTSVGYGASFGGLSALLSMLNSCASGVSVVNIDNGFGAGYLASMINHMD